MIRAFRYSLIVTTCLALAAACGGKKDPAPAADQEASTSTAPTGAAADSPTKPDEPTLKTDKGVDATKKVITIGMLNDESGPGATIGKPFALGKRILAAQVNAGKSGLLPEGWTIELVEQDHGYNPQKSLQAFNKIKDEVLFIGTSFGTPNTLPLRPHLERAGLMAFPASLSSKMAEHKLTPPLGPGYDSEAMRAVDWFVASAGGADKVKAAIVYQKDDYGADGLAGFKAAAAKHGLTIASEQSVTPTQKEMAAVVTKLKEAGATHVLLTTLPGQTAAIVGTAAKMGFGPTWVGQTPSWIDVFFAGKLLPTAVFANFHWVQGLPTWGEQVEGMPRFIANFAKHRGDANPDFYILTSYIQGLVQLEGVKRAIASGDVTRAGFAKAVRAIKGWNADGMINPIDMTQFPYATSIKTRILKPDFAKKSWTVVADYAEPSAK